jgi:Fe-S-cluster-containing hydrogenase component 2
VRLVAISDNCSGCRVCKMVCAMSNFREVNPAKSALKIEGHFPDPGKYQIKICTQCGKCAEVCPTNAINPENGIYLINEDECVGCMACVEACPEGVMFEHKNYNKPIKCTLCGDCAEICPREALVLQKD